MKQMSMSFRHLFPCAVISVRMISEPATVATEKRRVKYLEHVLAAGNNMCASLRCGSLFNQLYLVGGGRGPPMFSTEGQRLAQAQASKCARAKPALLAT